MKKKSIRITALIFFFIGFAAAMAERLLPLYGNHSNHKNHSAAQTEDLLNILHQPLRDMQNTPTSLADIIGEEDTILVNFWATWCTPCLREMPLLQEAAGRHRVKTIGISYEDIAQMEKFLAAHPVAYPLYKSSYDIFHFFQQQGNLAAVLPYTILINAKGEVIKKKIGDFKTIEEVAAFTQG